MSMASDPARALVVEMHDVAPATWPACSRVLAAVEAVARVPVSLLVVPNYHGDTRPVPAEFRAAMNARIARGDELVLHGLTHRDPGTATNPIDRLRREWYTSGEGEFSALGEFDAWTRIRAGLDWFDANGWKTEGFVAPAWLMSEGAWRAVARTPGLRYTATLTRLISLPDGAALASRALVYSARSAWRRRVSIGWNRAVLGRVRHAPLARLALHPSDADDGDMRRAWQEILAALAATRAALTTASYVRWAWPKAPAPEALLDGLR